MILININMLSCIEHSAELNMYCNSIIDACLTASDKCIPSTRKKGLAGWRDNAKPARDEAIFWHKLWIENGRPRNGYIADIRRRTRAKYKHIVRMLKREQNNFVSSKMGQSLQANNKRPFWNEVKRMHGKSSTVVNNMDSASGPSNICNLFASTYKELYNCVSYDSNKMHVFMSDIEQLVINKCGSSTCINAHCINANDVSNAISKLKKGKSDGTNNLISDALIYGCDSLHVHLSLMFSAILHHGVSPDNMLLASLVPIPKSSKKCLNNSSNYRAIALGSIVCKVLDTIIMTKCETVFQSSDYQFGFKTAHSTTQCSFIVQEIIEFYNNNGSPVYLATLDASQAFDRVEYVKLFELLRERKMCPMYIRLLLHMYTHQKLQVKWNGFYSSPFGVSNGVKQGAILSPLLFCLYIDGLFIKLKQLNIGCSIGGMYMGCVGYADDVCLLAPSCFALCKMLEVCESFGLKYHVKFNSTKSHITICNKGKNILVKNKFMLNNNVINVCGSVDHLGHIIDDSEYDRKVIDKAISDLYMRTNYIMSKFSGCSSDVRNFLFRTYCTNFYGSVLWNLTNVNITRFYIAWRKCVRRIWGLPRQTHCSLLIPIYIYSY